MKIWELVMAEISERMEEMIPGAPPDVETQATTDFELGGPKDRDHSVDEPDQTWPAMGKMYTEYSQGHNRYRTGGRELAREARLPQTTSLKKQWLGANEAHITDRRLMKMEWASK